MRRLQKVLLFMALLFSAAAVAAIYPSTATTADSITTWDFDSDPPGTLPKDFSIGTLFDGRPAGEWKVLQTDRAQSPPHVLGQLMGKGAEHAYKVVLLVGITASDLDLQVSFLPIEGKAD